MKLTNQILTNIFQILIFLFSAFLILLLLYNIYIYSVLKLEKNLSWTKENCYIFSWKWQASIPEFEIIRKALQMSYGGNPLKHFRFIWTLLTDTHSFHSLPFFLFRNNLEHI